MHNGAKATKSCIANVKKSTACPASSGKHIFGTMKRKWGYSYTDLNGLEEVNGEHSLICWVYNIKRTINILGFEKLMKKLKNWTPNYKGILLRIQKWDSLEPFYAIEKYE